MNKHENIFHKGELEIQKKYGFENFWTDEIIHSRIFFSFNEISKQFIESLPFFFISTSDADGNCDCSFRGIEDIPNPGPALKIIDDKTLIFPDFSGNNLFNSLGNMHVNPHIGMLFIDFKRALRMRLNGKTSILDNAAEYKNLWPGALRIISVTIEQLYPNCQQRIHASIKKHLYG